ncbi:extracellular solute-binding protein [Pseudonocardia sp. MH-G8]|uniref:extracellular solute-binding protein n=1 Tax=Pseudonocardia sp. MH-G8 TaxID=1854588 RepID=UPI000B9FFEAA|nr:extracellular solute-binding protein [Pseudonocardia sp. MH-G8]OZM77384.1 ABC transporter substrate-binding protein [Pseudonocardia sp. MH-G8]
MITRRGFLALGAAAVGGALAGCSATIDANAARVPAAAFPGEYTGPPRTLQFWNPFTGGDGPTMAKIVDAFNAAHPQITVEMTSLNADDMYAKVLPAVGAGHGPDVAIMHLDQLSTFAIRGTIVVLDDLVAGLELGRDDFVPAVWEQGTYQDRRYGIPLDVFTGAQYWNTEAFAAAGISGPLSGDTFDAAMAALQGSGVENPYWVASDRWQLFVGLLGQFGGSLFDEAGTRATFASQAGVEALTWMRATVERGYSPQGVTNDRPPLKNGSSALLTDLPATIPDLRKTAPDLAWDVAPLPQIGTRPGAFANSHNFVLTQQSQADPDVAHAAQVFVDWTSRNSTTWVEAGMTPARNLARDTDEFRAAPQARLATAEVFDNLFFLPQVPSSRDIAGNSYERAVSEAMLGRAAPADALAFAQDTAQRQLDDFRELYTS